MPLKRERVSLIGSEPELDPTSIANGVVPHDGLGRLASRFLELFGAHIRELQETTDQEPDYVKGAPRPPKFRRRGTLR
jgi:hypothetical protein